MQLLYAKLHDRVPRYCLAPILKNWITLYQIPTHWVDTGHESVVMCKEIYQNQFWIKLLLFTFVKKDTNFSFQFCNFHNIHWMCVVGRCVIKKFVLPHRSNYDNIFYDNYVLFSLWHLNKLRYSLWPSNPRVNGAAYLAHIWWIFSPSPTTLLISEFLPSFSIKTLPLLSLFPASSERGC